MSFGDTGRMNRGHSSVSIDKEARTPLKEVPFHRIIALFRPHTFSLIWILSLALVAAMAGLVPPLLMKQIIDHTIPGGNIRELILFVGLMILLPLASGLLGVWQNHWNTVVGQDH